MRFEVEVAIPHPNYLDIDSSDPDYDATDLCLVKLEPKENLLTSQKRFWKDIENCFKKYTSN